MLSIPLFVTIVRQLSQTYLFIGLGTRVVCAGGLSQSLKNNSSIVRSLHLLEIRSCYIAMAVLASTFLCLHFPRARVNIIALSYD